MDRIIMDELIITKERIDEFRNYLRLEEKSKNTIEKYMRDIKAFWQYAGTQVITKELAIAYKENLLSNEYAVRSVNSTMSDSMPYSSCFNNSCMELNLSFSNSALSLTVSAVASISMDNCLYQSE